MERCWYRNIWIEEDGGWKWKRSLPLSRKPMVRENVKNRKRAGRAIREKLLKGFLCLFSGTTDSRSHPVTSSLQGCEWFLLNPRVCEPICVSSVRLSVNGRGMVCLSSIKSASLI
ncbi:uncharacterized protein LOC113290160 [Papaver somniferum]|uniref:uncharacterized protein LOC113290160 n=1 Tax=Papaver somniferum TaxID=3469 RepID=UPI000E705CF4|nr:uncharacterized protein LOC113290160 [Papaver somniferum]XP_026395491.1 uncharacterized protein LOC113290160 [Papaver somniferum]